MSEHTPDQIDISADKSRLDLDYVHAQLHQQYWCAGIPRSVVNTAVANSMCFGVYLKQSGQQIGFARVVTDYATFAYLADVFIDEAYRGRSYAKQLIAQIRSHPTLQGLRRWMLMTRDAHSLYQQFGFSALAAPERAMEHSNPTIYQT